jgi:hypothetical protein
MQTFWHAGAKPAHKSLCGGDCPLVWRGEQCEKAGRGAACSACTARKRRIAAAKSPAKLQKKLGQAQRRKAAAATMSKKRSAPDPDLIWTDGEVQGVISNHKAKNQQLVACNRRQLELIEHLQLQLRLPRCPPMQAAESNAKLARDLAGSEKMVLRQAQRLGELEEERLARGAQADALARITSLEGDIAQAEAAARVDYQHYTQQEFDLRLQIKSLTETKDDIFKNGLGLYNDLISLRTEHEAAQAATAAAQAATAVAQAEAAADRAKAVRICTALAGTDANADRTPTAQLEAARQYIAPEFAEDADDYIREQAQEAVDYVINARKEQELQEAAGGDNYI